MLMFSPSWRFDSPGEIPDGVRTDFSVLIRKIAAQGSRKAVLEHFKSYFAAAAGVTVYPSSNADWAETDLNRHMSEASKNSPLFVEAFFDACEALRANSPQLVVPELSVINRVLLSNDAGYEIDPPNLISNKLQEPTVAPPRVTSLDDQAQEIIQRSLKDSEQLLSQGRHRQAVQEILWLLETVSTAFRNINTGAGTVQGKYFNKIAQDLRKHYKGTSLDQVLNWITTLHGYLSSPTGGGIRHGVDLKAGVDVQSNEARLFCNLIRSYISFLIAEHERLSTMGRQQ